jgi:DNA-binding protein H-NS
MAQTYAEIQQRIAALQVEAQALLAKEVAGVVERIQAAIAQYGLTAEQLFAKSSVKAAVTRVGKRPAKAPAKKRSRVTYSDGSGNTWSGMGKRPNWLRVLLDTGKTLEDLVSSGKPAIAKGHSKGPSEMPSEAAAQAPATKKTSIAKSRPKRRKAKTTYKDDAGHSWSGFGPKPGWLKEALAAGRKLEEFAS